MANSWVVGGVGIGRALRALGVREKEESDCEHSGSILGANEPRLLVASSFKYQ